MGYHDRLNRDERRARRASDRSGPIDVVDLWCCTCTVLCALIVLGLLWRWLA